MLTAILHSYGVGFDHLDSTVQTEFENYLDERAINQNLGSCINPRRA